jgi:hypothetical protein
MSHSRLLIEAAFLTWTDQGTFRFLSTQTIKSLIANPSSTSHNGKHVNTPRKGLGLFHLTSRIHRLAAQNNSTRISVKVEPATHGANTMTFSSNSYLHPTTSAKVLLQTSCQQEVNKMKNDNPIETSFDDISEAEPFLPCKQ